MLLWPFGHAGMTVASPGSVGGPFRPRAVTFRSGEVDFPVEMLQMKGRAVPGAADGHRPGSVAPLRLKPGQLTRRIMSADNQKRLAAERALTFVTSGMKLGLGTGSTAAHFVAGLGERVRKGHLDVVGVPTSEATHKLAVQHGVPLTTLDETPELDLTVDGADELDGSLRLVKGGGGALLREKIVAAASARMVVIADASKVVERLGAFPLPIEVIPFGQRATAIAIDKAARKLGLDPVLHLRMGAADAPFRTDSGNLIYDCDLSAIPDPEALADALSGIPGVVEHGLFIGLCSAAVIAGADEIRVMGKD